MAKNATPLVRPVAAMMSTNGHEKQFSKPEALEVAQWLSAELLTRLKHRRDARLRKTLEGIARVLRNEPQEVSR